MDIPKALNILVELTATATNTLIQVGLISALIQKAQSEGRTTFTPEEWATIDAADQASKQALLAAIAKALGTKP